MTGLRLRFVLFLGLIVGPAGILTFLSLRAALDERRSALADVRARVPALRGGLDARLREIAAALPQAPADSLAPDGAATMSAVRFHFALDADGALRRPALLRPAMPERSADFAAALARGEQLEFGGDDPASAAVAYDLALGAAATAGERAEALNSLGRVVLAAGDTAHALETHRRLRDFARALDADGAHPLTLSTLRLVRTAAGTPDLALDLAEAWVAGMQSGAIPFHPGTRLAVDGLRPPLRQIRWHVDRPDLLDALEGIAHRADFLAAYDRLLETAVVRREATYLCGPDLAGGTLLAVLRPAAAGGAVGAVIDLEALAAELLALPAGQPVAAAGFGLALFDADEADEFGRQYADELRVVSPAHPAVYRLHLGLYARDEPFVFERARNRSALWVGGIAVLAAAIGLGLWVLLRETAREVETARLRSEFVANVSHELRTPLTSIRMYAETLLENRVRSDDQRRDYLATIMRESQRLSRMVGNILEVSRMESGRKSFTFADTDVGAVVRAALEEFEPVFGEQGFRVDVDISASLPRVSADAEALETAVANLVGNAVKYSPQERHVTVHVSAEKDRLCIDVADRGVGIPEAERRAIFDKHRRASNAADVATGAGLGLALVAGIARSHGGSIAALPRDGGGTRFRLTLPLTRRG